MHTYSQTYLPKLQAYQNELVERLELLVNIDSGSGQTEGINSIMTYLEQWLKDVGFSVTLHPSVEDPVWGTGNGHNLVAKRQGRGGPEQRRLVLVGHVDTVYPSGAAKTQPFSIHDGIALGPGVIDMKSGVLMGIYALRVLLESGFEEFGQIYVVFNNDEEVGSVGSAHLLREIARQVDVGLVLEPSRDIKVLTNARKGVDRYLMEVVGIPAHSGAEPHKGRSAVVELAHKILAVHNLHTIFQGTTFNITRLSSSERFNIVPDIARCYISVRAHDEHALSAAAAALEKIATGCSIPDTQTILTRFRGRKPYKATPEINQLVEIARVEGEALGFQLSAEGKGGVSDANLLVDAGIPTLDGLGPVGGSMHDLKREHLQVDSLPLRGALLAGLIQQLCLLKLTGK